MKANPKQTFALVLALACPLLARAEPPSEVQQEVRHLLAYIEESGCEFSRNGVWSSSRTAQQHLRTRYDSLARQGRIRTTRDFIEQAAAEAALSGKTDEVRCGLKAPVPSGNWLSDELARYQSLQR